VIFYAGDVLAFTTTVVFATGISCSLVVFSAVRYLAKIVEVDDHDMTVLIHYDGWNQRYDEWFQMTSDHLRPLAKSDGTEKKVSGTKLVCSAYNLTF